MTNDIYLKIKENENLIYKIASKYSNEYSIDDLYQAGCIGIIKACKKYNDNYNAKFSTYAYKYILGEMIDFIRKDKNIIVSDETYDVYRKYVKIKGLLCNKYNREVSFSEVCKYMNIDEKYMLSIIESVNADKIVCNELYDNIYVDNRDLLDNQMIIEEQLSNLNDYEKMLINYRYYMDLSQIQTASLLGVSQVKVSRNEKLILKKIKDNIAN